MSSFLDALRAYGPAAGERLMLFGQFVGVWAWHSPTGGLQTSFVARAVGDEIVLEATDSDTHWIFSEVEESSFRWRAEEAGDIVQTMDVRRIA